MTDYKSNYDFVMSQMYGLSPFLVGLFLIALFAVVWMEDSSEAGAEPQTLTIEGI
jgi:hypothetical protein